jgi:adenosylhomocysteinase
MNKSNLIQQGKNNIALAEERMDALMKIRERFKKEKPFKGLKIAMALHITKETAVLIKALKDGGAEVAATGCNPLSTQDDVAEALRKEGLKVYGYKGESSQDYYRFLNKVLDIMPNITIDDGMDLVSQIHTKRPELIKGIIGGCEETTTGIIRLRAMQKEGALKYPIIAVNDNRTKHLMDNYYGTGQSTIDGIIRATNVLFAGKNVVIAGYGDCGKGCALRAKGLGANVIVTEVDEFPALQAHMDGFKVMKMEEACKIGDIFITVTGNKHVIRVEHMRKMKNGAIMANSGHFDIEIDAAGLEKVAKQKKRVRPFMDRYTLSNNKSVYLLAEGRLVNLSAAEGHPSEVMSMSFCGQALACEYLVKENSGRNADALKPRVYLLPEKLDQKIAALQLKVNNIKIDKLTSEQFEYLKSWKEGTN